MMVRSLYYTTFLVSQFVTIISGFPIKAPNLSDLTSSSSTLPTTTDYEHIFRNDVPLLDVRAPVEFAKGSFANARNVPILGDEHRALVGTCYKEKGSEAAQELGASLVTVELRDQMIASWKDFVESHPGSCLFCFRGGLRSHIAQAWLYDAGVHVPLVKGGYKAMRNFLMEQTAKSARELPIVLVAGRTTSGKTELLPRLRRWVDLEGLAKHRGSSFGNLVEPQPSQIDFENNLSVTLLKLRQENNDSPMGSVIFMEDEGRRIGDRILPLELHQEMLETYPLVVLEAPIEERVERCIQDYVTDLFPHFVEKYGEMAHDEYSKWSFKALFRIKKRLGGDRYAQLQAQLQDALDRYASCKDETGFYEPLKTILVHFYDPMYDYQLSLQPEDKILFRGTADEIVEWAQTYTTECYEKRR